MNAPNPLPELHITEMFDGQNPVEHVIQINTLDENGITIGRAGNIKVSQNYKKEVCNNISRYQATVYATENIARNQKDIWLHAGYKDREGRWVVSGKGTGVWLADRPINPDQPVQLRPGALLKIVPRIAGYQCILEWGTYPAENGNSNPPTVPMGAYERDKLYFENRSLKEQAEVKDLQIEALQNLSRQHKTLAEEMQFQTQKLNQQIKRERDINTSQDKKIARIRILGVVTVLAVLLSLGIEVEQIDKILEVIAVLSGAGLLWTGLEKSKPA